MAEQGLLAVMAASPWTIEREFEMWRTNRDHALRTGASRPPFIAGACYRAFQGQPRALATYDLAAVDDYDLAAGPAIPARLGRPVPADPQPLQGAAVLYRLLFALPDAPPPRLVMARALLLVGLDIDPERADEFRDWYDSEHLPRLARVSGVFRARRFVRHAALLDDDAAPTYLALYDLERPEVVEGPAWRDAVETPWTARMRRFFTRRWRGVYSCAARVDGPLPG